MTKWWMIRAGEGRLISVWIEKNIASIGWGKLGNLANYNTKEKLLNETDRIYGGKYSKSKTVLMHQLWKFSHEISKGDMVITFHKDERKYFVGTVTGHYCYNPDSISDKHPNIIEVDWKDTTIDRSLLSEGAKNSLGSVLTVFRVDKWGDEFESFIK